MKKRGFTLVEMMVAVSIFAIVALVATDAFITADRISKKAQAMKTIVDNLHFALNVIAFNLQQGGLYHCIADGTTISDPPTRSVYLLPASCPMGGSPNGGTAIAFQTPKSASSPKLVIYRFQNNGIQYSEQKENSTDMTDFTPITIDNLDIAQMKFYVVNAENSGMPRVFMTISGKAKLGKDESPFQLQTVISERL